jgi:hypothetical protein
MTRALAALLVCVACAACAKAAPDQPPASGSAAAEGPPELVPPAEIQRARDACADYVARACACAKTVPAVQHECDLSKGEPEAIRLSLEVAQSPDSSRKDAIDAQRSVRKVAKACVEALAKLPTLGCAP